MASNNGMSRRGFVGGVATAVGALTLKPGLDLFGEETPEAVARRLRAVRPAEDPYDLLAKLSFNENPYGPPESVLKAMTTAFKYANRYGYPDGDIVQAIAKHHGLDERNVLLAAGSGEILDVVGTVFAHDKKVIGVEPSYGFVYSHVASVKGGAITLPLTSDYRQDIKALIDTTKKHYRDVGFVYLCNPNNPTGRIVTKQEIRQLLDGIPDDVPVLIDEAYHHFVEDPNYATSVPYVLEGRRVIVTRTFSKIAALAGMRLGYAITQPDIIREMDPYMGGGSINAVVKWGGVAALKDTASQAQVKKVTLDLRKQTTRELETLGYPVIPSETNFFMVHLKRPVRPVIAEFEKKGVLVGRPFPPMTEHLRVSVGNPDEMKRFMVAFKEIMAQPVQAAAARPG